MDLSIIIVSWNTRELLAGCLDSVRAALDRSTRSAEVLVVDNGSSDGSPALLSEKYSWVRAILNAGNPGFAAANNQGIAASRGAMVLLLNSDTIVSPGALDALLDYMQAHPEAGAAAALLRNPDGSLQESCYPEPSLWRECWRLFHLDRLRKLGVYDMSRWPLDAAREVDNILGACMLLRRETIDRVGPMDEGYFMYSEEIDWCLRIRRAGWRVTWVPQAEIVHLGGQSTRQRGAEMFLYLYRAKIRYFRKHHGRAAAGCYKLILAAASCLRLALLPLAWLLPAGDRKARFELAGNYYRLVRALPAF